MHISGSYKNVPKTIATRYQLDVAARLITSKRVSEFQLGPGNVVFLEDFRNGRLIDEVLGGNPLLLEFYHCNWVEVNGTTYKTGCYLVTGLDENLVTPAFIRVLDILARNQGEDILFFGEKLSTISFNCHYHAWALERFEPKQYAFCNP